MAKYSGRAWSAKPPLGTPVNWSDPITSNLIGLFDFQERGGSVLANRAVPSEAGVLEGSPTFTTGLMGNGITFNGTTQDVVVTQPYVFTNPFSAEVWLSWISLSAFAEIFSADGAGAPEVRLNGAATQFQISQNASALDSTTGITTGLLYQIVGVFGASVMELYVNGQSQGTVANASSYSPQGYHIGDRLGGSLFANFQLFRAALWNRELRLQEVSALYANPSILYVPQSQKLPWNLATVSTGMSIGEMSAAMQATGIPIYDRVGILGY